MTNLPSVLKQLRKRDGYTQATLAAALKISKSTISMYEIGAREPDLDSLEKLADLFGVDLNYLVGSSPTDVSFDDFTYALHNESKELTDENKQKLLEMARLFKMSQNQNTK